MAWIEVTVRGSKQLVNMSNIIVVEPHTVTVQGGQAHAGSILSFNVAKRNDLTALHYLEVQEGPAEIERRLNAVSSFVGR